MKLIKLPALIAALIAIAVSARAADTATVSLAGSRTQFNNQEPIELAVLYRNDGGNATSLPLEIRHEDGSVIALAVPTGAAAGQSQSKPVTLKAGSLKAGHYVAAVKLGTNEQTTTFAVHPAEHKNAYLTGQWVHHGGTVSNALAKGGWMYMNTDYVSLHPRKPAPGDLAEGYVAASTRPFALMVCGGGHQLDLDMPNDWGDPWVQRAVAWRCQLAALSDRIYPMVGLHLYDEPGLTWWPITDATNKVIGASPFAIPHQLDEFKKLTGKDIPYGRFEDTLPKVSAMMDDWIAFMDMRMKYLGQCWYASVWGTESVAPQFAIVNQVSSSYAPHDVTDGVDSQQNKPYKILSGHGQYSDLPFGTLQPLRAAESYQGFSWGKPHLYLPMWYTHSWATIRAAVWVSWASKLEGMLYTPEMDFAMDNSGRGYFGSDSILEIAEINRRLAMVGGVMNQLPKTLAPVAVLQSHNQVSWDIASMNTPDLVKAGSPPYASMHRDAINACFFRVLETGLIPNTVDEAEAVEKGAAFLKQWKVVFCPALTWATPKFRKVLEDYIAGGGKLIQFKGDRLVLQGSIVADHTYGNGTEYWLNEIQAHSDAANKAKAANDPATFDAENAKAALAGTDLAWRKWNKAGAPNFAADLAGWLGPQPYASANPEVLLGVHSAGDAHYLLLANNAQSVENPRTIKHELIPAQTTVKLPAGGVVYDLFNGGKAGVTDGAVPLKLAAGDGACLLHLPAEPGAVKLSAKVDDGTLTVDLTWGTTGYLPFRIRIVDPAGKTVGDYFRATTPGKGATTFSHSYALGENAAAGKWTVRVDEWLTGSSVKKTVSVKPASRAPVASLADSAVSVYFDDAKRIADLLSGKVSEPDWSLLNWDAKRVFGLNAKKFAVFAPEAKKDAAEKVAAALRAKGMTVDVNPAYEIKPFVREPNRGGAGPQFREGNFENIVANTVVLPGHPLAAQSVNRGHINRLETPAFPGPGRAYIQWGMSCYQMGFQNVFVFGDTDAGVEWLLAALSGSAPAAGGSELKGKITVAPAAKPALPQSFTVAREIKLGDTPVGVGSSPDGKITYVATHGGSVAAYDAGGKELWNVPVLLEAGALAVSPKGDRVAVGGYPGLLVLDAANGKVLDGFRAAPKPAGNWILINRIGSVAWNSAGTRVAGGWVNNKWGGGAAPDPHDVVVLDANGKALPFPKTDGNVFGVAFVPNTDTLLIGADKLTAVNSTDGMVLWANDIGGAQAFAFSADGQMAAAGGWGKTVGLFKLTDGSISKSAKLDSVVGGVALTPANDLITAVWGGTHPLFAVNQVAEKDKDGKDVSAVKVVPFLVSDFGFQNVIWSAKLGALVAAEQGGKLWLVGADGRAKGMLDEEAGTTAYRMLEQNGDVLVGRMNRVVQRLAVK